MHLKVQPMVFTANQEIIGDIDIEKRNCRFADEAPKESSNPFGNMFSSYNSQGCEFACIARESLKLFQCLPHYVPTPVRKAIPHSRQVFEEFFSILESLGH